MAEWISRPALKLLASLRCGSGSNPFGGSCLLLTEVCSMLVHFQKQCVPPAVETDKPCITKYG